MLILLQFYLLLSKGLITFFQTSVGSLLGLIQMLLSSSQKL